MNMVQITPWNPDDRVHIDEVYTNLSWLRDHKTPRGTSQKKLKDYGEIFQKMQMAEKKSWKSSMFCWWLGCEMFVAQKTLELF